jgi:RNA polymerase sigma factor (sigma-70 family)
MNATLQAVVLSEYPRVKRFMRSKLPEPDCYDAAQEAMKAFLAIDPARMTNPAAYLMGVARMHVLKYFERHRPSEQFDSTRVSVAQLGTSMSVQLDRRNLLLHALRSLPLDHQTAFELRYAEELSLDEVAEVLGVSLATVKRYLASARSSLALLLGAAQSELGDRETAQLAEAYRRG